MKRGLAAAIALSTSTLGVQAAGYDDFTQGMTANLRGDYVLAVTSFTKALAAPDLVAAYRPAAYRGRAEAYLNLDKCPEAMADIKAFESLKANDSSITLYRIEVELCLKDAAAARKDIEGLAKGKLDSGFLFEFSRMAWRYGLYDDATQAAREAFRQAEKDQRSTAYILLWQALTALRAGHLDAAEITASRDALKLTDWPKPVFDLYLGKISPDALQEEAASWHEDRDVAQRCEANFYIAEWHMARTDTAAATPLFLAAARNCPEGYIEWSGARSELKRLGVPLPED